MPLIYRDLHRDGHSHVCRGCTNPETGRHTIWLHLNPVCKQGIFAPCPECGEVPLAPVIRIPVLTNKSRKHTVRITDEAKHKLAVKAYYAGYLRNYNAERLRGLGAYIEHEVSNKIYVDNRPDYMREMDNKEAFNYGKYWLPEGETRRYLPFKAHNDAYIKLLEIGVEHGIANITRRKHYHVNTAGLVLEAIAREWLVPIQSDAS